MSPLGWRDDLPKKEKFLFFFRGNVAASFFWFTTLFCLFFQCYCSFLSRFLTPSVCLFILFEAANIKVRPKSGWFAVYCIYFAYLISSAVLAYMRNYSISALTRFFLILVLIPVVVTIRDGDFKTKWKIFKILSTAFCISIFVIWLSVLISGDFTPYRLWAYKNGAGDIYVLNGRIKVQLRGCALFAFAFAAEFFRARRITPYAVVMAAGALIAGNDAYLIGIGIPIFIAIVGLDIAFFKKKSKFAVPLCICLVVIIAVGALASLHILGVKAESSTPVRIGQAKLLLDTDPIFGKGLGHPITGTAAHVTYNGSEIYFEMQTLYIFNQVGLVGLALFYILTFWYFAGKRRIWSAVLYLTYLLYAFWNPYCFDTNHIIALYIISHVLSAPVRVPAKKSA